MAILPKAPFQLMVAASVRVWEVTAAFASLTVPLKVTLASHTWVFVQIYWEFTLAVPEPPDVTTFMIALTVELPIKIAVEFTTTLLMVLKIVTVDGVTKTLAPRLTWVEFAVNDVFATKPFLAKNAISPAMVHFPLWLFICI